jgi:hypothetical protein
MKIIEGVIKLVKIGIIKIVARHIALTTGSDEEKFYSTVFSNQ